MTWYMSLKNAWTGRLDKRFCWSICSADPLHRNVRREIGFEACIYCTQYTIKSTFGFDIHLNYNNTIII